MTGWLLGTLLATAFASAGPIYYERVTGDPGPFAPLMTRLEAQPDLQLHEGIRGLYERADYPLRRAAEIPDEELDRDVAQG